MNAKSWRQLAAQAALHCARSRRDFTADDVWESLRRLGVAKPEEVDGRVMGNLLMALRATGDIVQTGEFRASMIAAYHGHRRSVWRRTTPEERRAHAERIEVAR